MIRIGTFNTQNLFSRPKVFNFFNNRLGDEKLEIIAQLQNELERAIYDKPKILSLYNQVRPYIKFNVVRSNVGFRIINGNRVVANGRKDWFGFIELKREKFNDISQRNISRVIREIDADILAIVEVESRPVLKQFNGEALSRMYPYNILIDGNDNRGIDVGLYSKFPIENIRTHLFEQNAGSRIFSRDCLEVEVKTPGDESVHLLVNHLKSKAGRNQAGSDARRKNQADRVNEIVNEYNLNRQNVVVLGDLNDTPNSNPLRSLMSNIRLSDVLELEFNDPKDRWTYHFRGNNQQIDYLLASEALKGKFVKAGVERRGIANLDHFTNGAMRSFSTVTSWRNQASDHAAVWADFDVQ